MLILFSENVKCEKWYSTLFIDMFGKIIYLKCMLIIVIYNLPYRYIFSKNTYIKYIILYIILHI